MTNYRCLDFMGYPAYRIGTDGSVWSRLRRVYHTKHTTTKQHRFAGSKWVIGKTWRSLHPTEKGNTYPTVLLRNGDNQTRYRIHTLVLYAFVGPRPKGMVARHFPDQNKHNNNIGNLSWTTPKQNMKDKLLIGVENTGVRNGMSKLTDDQVVAIIRKYANGATHKSLAAEFGISIGHAASIVRRETWKHLDIERPERRRRIEKDICPQGHPFTGDNLHINKHGHRVCRECQKLHARKYRAQNKQ